MIYVCALLIVLLPVSPGSSGLRAQDDKAAELRESVEGVEAATTHLKSKLNIARVRARAATLIWRIDRESGKWRFVELWQWIADNITESQERGRAQIEVLSQLYPLDRVYADELLAKLEDDKDLTIDTPLNVKLLGNKDLARLRSNIATRSIDEDLEVAEMLINSEIKRGYSFPLHSTIVRLAAKDQQVSDRVVKRLLEAIDLNAGDSSVVAAEQLFAYFFPKKLVAQSRPDRPHNRDLTDLYLKVASRVLERSLRSNQTSRPPLDQRLVLTSQALLAVRLNSVAGSFSTLTRTDLDKLALATKNLKPNVPPEMAGVFDNADESKTPSDIAFSGDQPGSWSGAKALHKTLTEREMTVSAVRKLISEDDYAEALPMILSVEDRHLQTGLLSDLSRALATKKEIHFVNYITRLTINSLSEMPATERKVEQILFLTGLELAGDKSLNASRFWILLDTLFDEINNLTPDAERLSVSPQFRKVIMSAVQIDKSVAITKIEELKSGVFALIAKLAVCESLLNAGQNSLK